MQHFEGLRTASVLLACVLMAGCSTANTAQTQSPARAQAQTKSSTDCRQAAQKAVEAQTNAAVIGSALSVAGGIGGFGGHGGAIVGQAASIGGTVVQAQARNQAQSAMAECHG
jgi:hypothetical protein